MPFYHDESIGVGGQKFAKLPAFKYANQKELGQPPAPFFTLSVSNHQALPQLLSDFLLLKRENNSLYAAGNQSLSANLSYIYGGTVQ